MSTRKLKVATIVGTRPEIIRLSRVMATLDVHCDHTVVHTGQNYDYELNGIFFEDLGLRMPDMVLNAAGTSSAETIGKVIIAADQALAQVRPDAVLVLGDTNSCMAVIPAKRRKIPTFHMEAGNRCFDMRVPEEINRRIVDHIADINLPYSDIARGYLLAEGLPPDRVIKTGSPMNEVLTHYAPKIRASNALQRLGLRKEHYFVVSCHREENVDSDHNFTGFVATLNAIAETYEMPVVVSTHPRTRKRIDALSIELVPQVRLLEPLGFCDYVRLQCDAKAVLSDSGTITEEASILNFRALNLREAHERPEGMEEGAVMMTGMHTERVIQCLRILENQPVGENRLFQMADDYNVTNVSEKIVRVIHSYVDYVNTNVWKHLSLTR